MVRGRGYVQRTRSPRSRRKNGIGAGRGILVWPGHSQVEPAAERNREGRATGPAGHDHGQGGWYRGAAAGAPRPSGEAARAGPLRA